MANTFKNYTRTSVGTASDVAYLVASNATAILVGVNLANTTASQIKVNVQVAGAYLIKDAPVPSGSALSALDGKIVLEGNDSVVVSSDTASSLDVVISVLELT